MIKCTCGRDADSCIYEIKPAKGFKKVFLNVINEKCACGKFVIELIRTKNEKDSNKFVIDKIIKTGKDAYKLLDKLQASIIKEYKLPNNAGKMYLNYSEYGTIKKCYSNLYTVKLGLFDNTTDMQAYRRKKAFLKSKKIKAC